MTPPTVRFLSLFVDDLADATTRLSALLGCAPRPPEARREAPTPHPFAGDGPVVFDLGTIEIALYRAVAARGTHAGDVGIGVETGVSAGALTARLAAAGARPLAGATPLEGEEDGAVGGEDGHGQGEGEERVGREMRVAMTRDRHFFELLTRG